MKSFSVYGKVVGTKFLGTYKAKNKKEAIELAAKAEGYISLCHQCSSECEDPELIDIIAEEVK